MQSNAKDSRPVNAPEFSKLIDLASARLGGMPVYANDEFFAEKENLVQTQHAVFIADKYTDKGKWMDGWETRRKRVPGHDWCVVRLGLPGVVRGVDIDTSHFLGNHPPQASLDGIYHPGRLVASDFENDIDLKWTEIMPKSLLGPGQQNFHAVHSDEPWTHVRLNIFPDGGVARLRVYGDVRADLSRFKSGDALDLAAVENGGMVLSCNDMFFGPKDNLIMPGRGVHMGDGWETKRKRQLPGSDWVIVKLAAAGMIGRLVLDTCHFKGNYPDRASLEGCHAPGASSKELETRTDWQEVLPETALEGHKIHDFVSELKIRGPFTHVRLRIFPDGGISRMRVFGTLA